MQNCVYNSLPLSFLVVACEVRQRESARSVLLLVGFMVSLWMRRVAFVVFALTSFGLCTRDINIVTEWEKEEKMSAPCP